MEPISYELIKRAVFKRFWAILLVGILGSAVAVFVAYVLPPTYTSEAKILIESQQIPSELAKTTVTSSTNERLELIQQRLMARNNILDLIERLDLFDNDPMTPTEQVAKIRESTSFRKLTLSRGRRDNDVAAFILSYSGPDPQVAARVVNELVTLVLEKNLISRSERANETFDFFKKDVEALAKQLADAEEAVADFQQANKDALPDTLGFRQKELSDLRSRRFTLERRLLDLQTSKSEAERRLELGRYGPEYADSVSPEEAALRQLERQLGQAKAVYASSHPQIRRLEAQIAQLRGDLDPAIANQTAEDRANARTLAREDLENKLDRIERDIELAEQEIRSLEERQASLEESISRTPQVAIELNSLQRNRDGLQEQYRRASSKLSIAETGQKLEVNRQAESFEVVEQAQVPTEPEAPKRKMIAAVGSVGSVGLAFSLAVLIEMLNRAIYTSSEMERRLQLRPLMTIPYIKTKADRRRRRRNLLLLVTFAIILPAVTLYALHVYYLPIDLLFDKVLERTGAAEMIETVMERLLE